MALIPFAYHKETALLVDVLSVARGKACECICPACQTPLIARHCKEGHESHFAHDPAFKDEQQYKECELSYHVALRLMLKQIINTTSSLTLPDYTLRYYNTQEPIIVTKAQTLSRAQFDVELEQKGFDAVVKIADHSLAIFIQYEGRTHIPENTLNLSGIVVLDISNLRLSSTSTNNNGYASQLVSLITELAAIKTWYWHVREDALKRKADVLAMERDQQLIAEHKQANQFKPAPMSEIEADFEREANNGVTYNSEAQTIAGISAQELIDYQSKIKKTRSIYQAVAGHQIKTSSMYRCSRCHLDFNFNQHSDQCPRCSTNFFSYPIR